MRRRTGLPRLPAPLEAALLEVEKLEQTSARAVARWLRDAAHIALHQTDEYERTGDLQDIEDDLIRTDDTLAVALVATHFLVELARAMPLSSRWGPLGVIGRARAKTHERGVFRDQLSSPLAVAAVAQARTLAEEGLRAYENAVGDDSELVPLFASVLDELNDPERIQKLAAALAGDAPDAAQWERVLALGVARDDYADLRVTWEDERAIVTGLDSEGHEHRLVETAHPFEPGYLYAIDGSGDLVRLRKSESLGRPTVIPPIRA